VVVGSSTWGGPPITNELAKDLGQTYGFYLGQRFALTKVRETYSELSQKTELAERRFDLVFGAAIEEIDSSMLKINSAKWTSVKSSIEDRIVASLAGQSITREIALGLVETVQARSRGEIESPVIEMLLMFNPAFQKAPVQEFAEGFTRRTSVDGSGNAKGLQYVLKYPKSWKSEPGDRPNITTKLISEYGRGFEIFLVIVKTIDLSPGESISEADIEEMLEMEGVGAWLPDGAKLLGSGSMQLEGLPGFWMKYDIEGQRLRTFVGMRAITYSLFYENYILMMQGQVGLGSSDEDGVERTYVERFAKFEPLFDQIAQSLILPQRY
jgi:hypothetical protein